MLRGSVLARRTRRRDGLLTTPRCERRLAPQCRILVLSRARGRRMDFRTFALPAHARSHPLPPPTPRARRSTGDPAWDLAAPAPVDAGYGSVCGAYAGARCCSDNYTATFTGPGGAPAPEALYPGYTYNQCPQIRNISAACVGFLARQECDFVCDPHLSSLYAAVSANASAPAIQLCPSMCDAWFAACADEYTCEFDWQTWNETQPAGSPFGYYCPAGACRTYRQTYGNASTLCTAMWAPYYAVAATDSAAWCVRGGATGRPAAGARTVDPRLTVTTRTPPTPHHPPPTHPARTWGGRPPPGAARRA